MFNHAPVEYKCPLCTISAGLNNEYPWGCQTDVFYKDDFVLAMINTKFFYTNPGHVILIPRSHFENIYDLPQPIAHHIFDITKQIAIALKSTRECDGITLLQNNEPASHQHVFHFHLHIIPRFNDDNLIENLGKVRVGEPEERILYVRALEKCLFVNKTG
jgi:histidine triad (HIT) family protein